MKNLIQIVNHCFKLQPLSAEEYANIKIKGMHFTIERYYAEGLGNVSVMQAKGFFGLMKMDTLIINPTERDMPLFSYDRVHAMGNDTLILELYDTCVEAANLEEIRKVKASYANMAEHDLGSHWYDSIKLKESLAKKGKKKETVAYDKLTEEYFSAFVNAAKKAPVCDADQKKKNASVYVEGLLSNGGPSTDIFKQYYGEEKTADLFRRILFGTL